MRVVVTNLYASKIGSTSYNALYFGPQDLPVARGDVDCNFK